MPLEYRVRWQREGRGQTTRIYQTWSAAYGRFCTIACWDDVKDGTSWENMPPLQWIVLESREVPAWEPHPFQPEVSDFYREQTRQAIRDRDPRPPVESSFEVPF
jgi:hypothetical protein